MTKRRKSRYSGRIRDYVSHLNGGGETRIVVEGSPIYEFCKLTNGQRSRLTHRSKKKK